MSGQVIKRPLAAAGLVYTSALAVSVLLESGMDLTVAIMAAIIGIAAMIVVRDYRRDIIIITIPLALGFGVTSLCKNSSEQLAAELGDSECLISGEVTEIPYQQYDRWYYIIQTDYVGIDGAEQSVKLRLSCRNSLEAQEGDRITGTVTFVQSGGEDGYNSETSLRANGIEARAWCSPYGEMSVESGDGGIRYLPQKLRRAVAEAINGAFPSKYAGMLCAMLLGDSSYLDDELTDNFRATGISHLLAASGLHVSIIACFVLRLTSLLRLPNKFSRVLTMLVILLFMAITGFSPSVTRAGIMHIMALIAQLIMRDADGLTSMSFSLLIMCLINPWSAADIGLQMSVSSTLGLILAAKPLTAKLRSLLKAGYSGFWQRARGYLAELLAVSLIASICTMPMSAVYFGGISLIAPITNILCVYPATLFIIIGAIAAALSVIPAVGWAISFPLKFVALAAGKYLSVVTSSLANFPLASVNSSYGYVPWFFLFAAAICLAAYAAAKCAERAYGRAPSRRRTALTALCCVFSLLLTSMLSHAATSSGGEIIVFGLEDGGVCVCAKRQTHALISEAGGTSYDLVEISDILSSCGVQKLDALAVSDSSDERSSIADDILEKYSPDYIALNGEAANYSAICAAAEDNATDVVEFGGEISLSGLDLSLKLFVDDDGNGWQLLSSGSVSALICPSGGDCALLPDEFKTCDAVIIGDGGVKNTIYLTVGAAIITADSQEAAVLASTLRVKGLENIYLTSELGAVKFKVKNDKLYIGAVSDN